MIIRKIYKAAMGLALLTCSLPIQAYTHSAEKADACTLTRHEADAENAGAFWGDELDGRRWYNYDRKSYFGIRVGLNVPRLFFRGLSEKPDIKSPSKLNVGLVFGNRIGKSVPIYFETGLLYSEKGVKLDATPSVSDRKVYNLRYLEIPFVFKYKADVGLDDLTIQPFFGGFVACGINGNVKLYEQRIKENPFTDKYLKRIDAGFRLGIGLAFQNFYLDFCYDIGMNNLAAKNFQDYHYDDFDGKIRSGCFTASIGLDF